MKTLLPKRTALARAVVSSLTGEVMPVERKERAFSRLLIQVLPALAVAGLFSPNAFAADNDESYWTGDYVFYGDGTVTNNVAYSGSDSQSLDPNSHNNIYGWKYAADLSSVTFTGVTITVTSSTVKEIAGIKIDTSTATDKTANGSTIEITDSYSTGVYGGYNKSGEANNNSVKITSLTGHSTVEGNIIGGYTSAAGASASGNSVYFENTSTTRVIAGGWSDSTGDAIGNTVTSVVAGGGCSAYGGYSHGGDASYNKVTVTDTNGLRAYGGMSDQGNANYNEVYYIGSVVSESHGGVTTGDGTAIGNILSISGSGLYGRNHGGYSQGKGEVADNQVTIDKSYPIGYYASYIYGGESAGGSVHGNSVTIKGDTSLRGGHVYVYGGYTTGSGIAYSNTVTIDNSTINIIEVGVVAGAVTSDGAAYANTVTITGSTVHATVYGATGNASVYSNAVTISDSTVHSVYGGYSEKDASITGNSVTLSGTIDASGSIYGGASTSSSATNEVSGNYVTISSDTTITFSDSYSINGGYSEAAAVNGNHVNISGGAVTLTGTDGIYGGRAANAAAVSNNYVSVSAGATLTAGAGVYGGSGDSGTVSNNYVAVSSSSTLDITGTTVYGGYTVSGTASDNYIQISGVVTTADQYLKIYGGYASESGKVSGNHIDIFGTSTTLASRGGYSENFYYGGYTPGSGDVSDNYISISGSNISISARSDIYGGYSTGAGAVSGNYVKISGDNISLSGRTFIYGASSSGAGTVSDNYVEISGKNLSISLSSDILGAYSNGGGDVSGNHVDISVNNMSIDNTLTVYGAYSYGVGTVSGNSVTISGSKATITSKDSKIYGGYSNSSGNVSDNTVNISAAIDGTVDIYGGYSGWGAISNNTVNLNKTVSGNVYAGYGANNGRVNNNTINVNGSSLDLTKATLYGRNDSTSGSGNALNLNSYTGKIQNIVNFDAINMNLTGIDLESGQAVVTLTADSTDISNSTITITSTTSSGSENVATTVNALADSYILITNANGNLTADGATANGTINVVQDSVLYMEYSLYVDEYSGSVLAVSPSYFGGFGDGDGNSGIKVTPAANILPEQHLAVASFLNTATDFVLDRKIECSANDNGSVGTCFFGAISGGELRQKLHGGSAATREDGTHFFMGVRSKLNNDSSKDIIGALWAEAGWGTVKATNSCAGAHGHDSYYGLGILGEHRQKEGALAGAYAQVFAHAGSAGYDVKTTLRSGNSNLSYDKNSMYMGAGIQLGYEFPFNDSLSLDTSINYRWLHLEGFKTTSNSIKYKVKDVESHRTRVGTRISYGKDKAVSNVYAGIAWEQEYSGKAKGSVNGLSISDPTSLKGSSGVIELGAKFKPSKKSRWSFDGSIEGYVGKREGVLGNVVVNYTF